MASDISRPRVYLAGPDVFFPDSERIFEALCEACASLGLTGVPPSDGGLSQGLAGTDAEIAERIYRANIALIQGADGVVANLCSFRGHEPDSGTVFEVGHAIALGKPVVGYGVPDGTYADRIAAAIPCARDAAGVLRESASGTMVESQGLRLNLMLACPVELHADAGAALARLAQQLLAARG